MSIIPIVDISTVGIFIRKDIYMNKQVFIKFMFSSKVHKTAVTVGDVAKVYCCDTTLRDKIRAFKIHNFYNPKDNRIIYSSLKVIELICNHFDNIEISHIGEPDFVIEYEPLDKKPLIPPWLGATLCCIIIFIGSAFAIMTFNTDVAITNLFEHLYEDMTGNPHPGFSILEISYSIGIGLGIIVFYNHFGPKRLTNDPTPLEMEMQEYETELLNALVDGAKSGEEHIDVI